MSTLVDIVRIVFFAYAVVLTIQMMQKMGNYKMTIVNYDEHGVRRVRLRLRVRGGALRASRSSIGGRGTASSSDRKR
jgi:hypothetical protein